MAGFAAILLAIPRVAGGAESSDVEELRREIRQLQGQIQRLSTAIAEAAEFDRQRAALLTRALKNIGSAPAAEAPPAKTEAPPPKASAPPPPPAPRAERTASVRRPVEVAPSEPAAFGTIRGKLSVPSGEPVAYVYVENVLAPSAKGQRKVIEQAGKKFVPNWAVIQRGTAIAFPNNDNIYHNVFSLSPGNSFDLGLYNSDGEAKSHAFTEPGAVDVYCNIHPQMAAYVVAVDSPFFAVSRKDGGFTLQRVPGGTYTYRAWRAGAEQISGTYSTESGRPLEIRWP